MTALSVTTEGYCHTCRARREIYRTVPWQDDACVRCGGTDVDLDD